MDLETLFLSSMVRRGPLFLYPRDRLPSFRYVLRPLASFSLSLPRLPSRSSLAENSNAAPIRASLPPRPRQLAPRHNFPFHRLLALYVYRRRCRVQSRVSLWSSGFSRYTVVIWLLLIIPRSGGGARRHISSRLELVVIIKLSCCALK